MSIPFAEAAIPISDSELRALLLRYRCENWKGIQPAGMQESIVDALVRGDSEELLRKVEPYVQLSNDSRILDLGSGVGGFVVDCRRRGLKAFGVEPDRIGQGAQLTAIQIARQRIADPAFVSAIGEKLPFPDASFDLVTMNQVIEHVTDQQAVVREAGRILRQGGVLFVACPNYLRFREPHYKIFWLPLMPKPFGRLYLRLLGRSAAMLDQLTYTTNRRLQSLLATLGPAYTIVDLHREQFLKKRITGSFSASSTRLVSKLTHVPLLGGFILLAILLYGSIREGGCEMVAIRKSKAAAEC
jgi:ubiquinone/menaquinone biosynthesis C-methylase UbiE